MFTGIVTNKGIIKKWTPSKSGGRIFIKALKKNKVQMGESISINGCCLTVARHKNNLLEFDISDETIRKTAFINYIPGVIVNLERAMKASDALGGHFVLGHIDSVGKISSVKKNKGSYQIRVSYAKKFAHLLIEKGSVAVDGVSLTVCNLKNTSFDLYIIPHTLNETSMTLYKKGDIVNLEYDVLGKYVYRQSIFRSG